MWRKVEQNDGCLPSFLDSSVQNNFDLVGFSAFAVTHPLLRLACRNHTCLCSTTAKAKLKLSKKSLKSLRKPNVLFYNTNRPVGLKCTRSLRLSLFFLFFFFDLKSWTATQSLVWKNKNKKATVQRLLFFRLTALTHSKCLLAAHVSVDSYQLPTKCRWPFNSKEKETKNFGVTAVYHTRIITKMIGSPCLGSVPASPTILGPKQSKLSKLIWTFTQALLFIVEIGFVSLSLSFYTTYTWGEKNT